MSQLLKCDGSLLCLTLCHINKILRFYATKQADEDATTTSGENLAY